MKSIIHVNQQTIARNRTQGTDDPPIIVRNYKGVINAREIEVSGTIRFTYSPHKPLKCGARLYAETTDHVTILR